MIVMFEGEVFFCFASILLLVLLFAFGCMNAFVSIVAPILEFPGESQQLPTDAEEICAIFSPAEEHSVNDQPKEQPDEDEVASMEVTHRPQPVFFICGIVQTI